LDVDTEVKSGSVATPPSQNVWRRQTPGASGWNCTAAPLAPRKYFMVSADCHAYEPAPYLSEYIEPEYAHRIPRVEVRDDGSQWLISEGNRPQRVKGPSRKGPSGKVEVEERRLSGAGGPGPVTGATPMDDEDVSRNVAGRTVEQRLVEQDADGVDIELIFPNKGLLCWATPDPVFATAMCRAWNRWAFDAFGGAGGWYGGRERPLASIAAGDIDGAIAEIQWAADNDVVGLCFGNSPIYGAKHWGNLEYNDPRFEPLWSLVEETGLPVTFHVSTGRDPRAVGGLGGAITNYVCHSMETTIEPLVQLITSGVFERHPNLQAGMVECGIGFIPWLTETMDHAYRAHHFWVSPRLADLPSVYFRRNCFATFQEDRAGLRNIEEDGFVDNVMWANDYPHHEGTWPHSKASIERQMGHLTEDSRAKILGLNAARVFKLSAPSR
jgi:hypothetical protein